MHCVVHEPDAVIMDRQYAHYLSDSYGGRSYALPVEEEAARVRLVLASLRASGKCVSVMAPWFGFAEQVLFWCAEHSREKLPASADGSMEWDKLPGWRCVGISFVGARPEGSWVALSRLAASKDKDHDGASLERWLVCDKAGGWMVVASVRRLEQVQSPPSRHGWTASMQWFIHEYRLACLGAQPTRRRATREAARPASHRP